MSVATAADHRLLDSLPQLVWTTLPDGRADYFSKRWVEYTGTHVGAGSTALECVHPEDVPRCMSAWGIAFATGSPYEIEYRLRRKDGVYRWHLALAHTVLGDDGAIIRWIGTSTDIEDQKRAQGRERFLANVSALFASSLDYESTLASVVNAAVPQMADACAIDLLTDGELTLAAVAHVDPGKTALMRKYRELYPAKVGDASAPAIVIRTREPQLLAEYPPTTLDDPARAALLREIGASSTLTVPLLIRGEAIGTLTFAHGVSERRFAREDLEVAQEVAWRAAISIDNARLYERALNEEARLRIAMDAGEMGSWEWEIGAGRVTWSPSLERIHGIPVGSFGGTFEDYQRDMHPDDRARVLPNIEDSLARRTEYRTSYRIIRPDGAVRWIEASGRFVLDGAGAPLRLLGVCMDITERKLAEEEHAKLLAAEQTTRAAAEHAERSLTTTLRSIGDAVITTEASGRITLMNSVAEALTGWTESEAAGRPANEVFRLLNAQTREEVASPVERVLQEGAVSRTASHTVLVSRKTGVETPIEENGAPIRDDQGVLTGVVMVFRDVSAKKRENALRDFLAEATSALVSSLDYRTTLATVARLAVPALADWCSVDVAGDDDALPHQVAVAHVDPEKVAMAESLAKRYPPDPSAATGVPNVLRTGRSELYSEIPDALLVAGAVDAEHLKLLRGLRLQSAMVVPLVARGRTLGAMTFVFADSGRRYTQEDLPFAEDLGRRAGTAMDNARLFASEQNARRNADEANRAKDEFLATVSHELRTPLNAMLGWTQLLRSGDLPPDRWERALETIERNTLSQAQLVEDLLDVARIVSGKLRLSVHPVALVHVVEEAVDSLRLAVDAKAIRLELRLDPEVEQVTGDPTRLQQIVWNLLSNAIKFTPKGGRIQVVLERGEASVCLSVTDDGRGIGMAFLPHVFERFRQAEGGITRTHGGLGLGLAISRHLVELHGGTIEVRSEGEGKGSTFKVVFPVAVHPPRPGARPRVSDVAFGRSSALNGLRVLVVDDEADTRELMLLILEESGAVATSADSLESALIAIEREPPDVLLSDIAMPGGDGYELIERVRKLPPERGGSVPAAALTAYARAEDRRRALNAGFMMHVPKPIEPAELVAVVTNLARFTRV